MSVNEKMTAIADNIREKTGGTEILTLDEMANGINEVYEAGKKTQREQFWESYLKNSQSNTSVRQVARFAGSGWNDDTFYPTQDIPVKYGYEMFYYNNVSNIKQRLEECNVKLVFDGANDVGMMFEESKTTEIPTIELNKLSVPKSTQRLCCNCYYLVTIEKIIAVEGNMWGNSFGSCTRLENVIFEGVIGNNISFAHSPLTIASLKSIITHLKDYSGTDSEYTCTVTFKTTAFKALEAEGNTSPNGNSWTEYIDDLKWNLTLA